MASSGVSGEEVSRVLSVPKNEWPDPQFCVQDANSLVTAIDDALSGPMRDYAISGYRWSTVANVTTVICRCADTHAMNVGDFLQFQAPADAALRATILRVVEVSADVSFTVVLEFVSGVPNASVACKATPVQRGDTTGASGGQVTSNVMRGAGRDGRWPECWISARHAHTRLLRGCRRVLVVRKATDDPEYIYWNAADQSGNLQGTSRAIGMAVLVANQSGASASLYKNDGVVSVDSQTATAASRVWLSAAWTIAADAAFVNLGVRLSGPRGSTFVLGEFTQCPSLAALPDGSFSTPRGQTVLALASVSPWVGARFTLPAPGGFALDMEQASNLVIGRGVSYFMGLLEGQCSTFPQLLSAHTPNGAPTLYDPVARQDLDASGHMGNPKYYAFAAGNWNMKDAKLVVYGETGATWIYVSWDIHGFVLFLGP